MREKSKNFLILGGIFISLEMIMILAGSVVPFSEEIRDLAYTLFVVLFFMFVFNKGLGIISWLEKQFPRTGIYFLYVGWLMYVSLLSGLGLISILATLENKANSTGETPDLGWLSAGMEIYYYLFYGAFVLSSLFAGYKIIQYQKKISAKTAD